MAVGFKVKFYWYQIGHGDFLHSFFSTVAYNLENGNWGSRFPVIMNELYQGKLECDNTDKALEELSIIKKEFLHCLTKNAEKFLHSVNNQLNELGIKIQYSVLQGEDNEVR